MTIPKIKLCWNGSRVEADWYLGLFGIYTRGSEGGRLRGLVISVRGLLAWLAGLTTLAYFSGALALWFWLDRRPHNYVTYADLILPTRWSGIQKLRGKALVAEGMDDIKARQWSAALAKLRTGIARNPEGIEGRLALAEILIAVKASRLAIEIYDGGFITQYPGLHYVRTVIKAANDTENHDWWLRTCDRALELATNRPDLSEDRRWLVQQKIAALIALDKSTEALALAEAENEFNSPTINELRVLALLKAGKPSEAVSFLKAWSDRLPRADPQVLRLQVRAFREAGNPAGMDGALQQLRALSPTDPRPYVYGIVQWLLAGRRADASKALDSFLLRFGSTPSYLHVLGKPLVEIGEHPFLEQLLAHALRQGFEPEPFRRFLVQVLVGKRDWRAASAAMAEIPDSAKKAESLAMWYEVTHAQIQAALDPADGAQSNLVNLVRKKQFTVGFYRELITSMRVAGRPATAREIITYAQGLYPQNTVIDVARKELDDQLAAERAIKTVVRPSRPAVVATPVPQAVRVELSEAVFRARLNKLTKAGDYAGALKYVRDARFEKPTWLPAREAELSREEIRFSGHLGDLLTLRSAVRLYNTGDRIRSAQVIEIARELNTAGHQQAAVLLLKELLAKAPDYTAAQRLLTEWAPNAVPRSP
jgi:hypothetical protein